MSAILIVLARKSSTIKEIYDFFMGVIAINEINLAISELISIGLVTKTENRYEINLDTLIRHLLTQ